MKARILALLAMVLGVVSCQTEPEGLDVNVGGEQEVAICVSLPEATRANADSALGAFANVDLSGEATIRYILQIFDQNDRPSDAEYVMYSDEKSVVFPVRLVPGRDYRFVVWADYVDSKVAGDKHYNTRNNEGKIDLRNITLKESSWVAMDETRDAFTGYYDTADHNVKYSSTLPINITLKRPFAKLRVITTDMKELGHLNIVPAYATVEYATEYRAGFNAFTSKAVEAVKDVKKAHNVFPIANYGDNETNKSKVLFTDYFFAEDDVVKFTLNVYEGVNANGEGTGLIKSNIFNTDIAAKRNYLTTIQGNILTDGNNITVEVKDAFENANNPTDEPYYYQTISSEAELIDAIDNGGEYIVISDIDVTGLVAYTQAATRTTGTTTPTTKTTTINLNGKTIAVTNKTDVPFATVAAGNILLLEGGNIVLTEGSTASFIKNEGNVVLTSSTINNESGHNSAAVIAGTIIVGKGTTVNDTKAATKGTEDWLNDVLTNGGTYVFTEDLTSKEIIVVTATNPVVLDGNGKTLKSSAGRAINVSGKNGANDVTIKNLNIVASGERAINVIEKSKKVTIENVTATAANYTVNVAASAPGAVVAIKNSTLNGLCTVNVASEGANVTVDGSTVNCNDNNTTEGESYAALCLNKDAVGGSIIATNSTINVTEGSDSTKGRNGAEDGVVTINGGVEGVVVMNAVINPNNDYYYSFETIQAAVEFAKSGDVISPIRDVELTEPLIIDGKTITIDLNGKTITGTGCYVLITNGGDLTITGGEWDVVAYTEVSTADELVAALEAEKSVIFKNDIKIDPANMSNAYGKTGINVKNGQTIDGNGKTLNIAGAGGTWDSGINTTGGLIKNLKVTGSFRGIFINHNSTYSEKVVLENVTIEGTVYTISCDQGLYQGIEATNCTFKGWTSFAETLGEAKFVNCTFGAGNGNNFSRPYASTEYVNCVFEAGHKMDPCNNVTFKNCKLADADLTVENINELNVGSSKNITIYDVNDRVILDANALYTYSEDSATVTAFKDGAEVNRYILSENTASYVKSISVGEGIVRLKDRCFCKNTNLESVTLPSSLTHIEEGAFQGSAIKSITIPENVTVLGKQSIGYCPELETIVINAKNVTIDNYVARACAKLKSVYIYSENVEFINKSMYFTNKEDADASAITFYVSSEAVAKKVYEAQSTSHSYGIKIVSIDGATTYYNTLK